MISCLIQNLTPESELMERKYLHNILKDATKDLPNVTWAKKEKSMNEQFPTITIDGDQINAKSCIEKGTGAAVFGAFFLAEQDLSCDTKVK